MKPSLIIEFWGVRGSIPSPGPSTMRYGGNTSCVTIDPGTGQILCFDAGTGIREMGKALAGHNVDLFIILSHNHWDHIQGFPFFLPIYQVNRKIHILPNLIDESRLCTLIDQMDGTAHFPVNHKSLPSQYKCVVDNPIEYLSSHGFNISRIPINHPGGGYGYRIENKGKSAVYLTDNELDPPYEKATDFDGFVRFCKEVDVLIHDAQYLEADMSQKHGWGHSLASQACELALAAEVKHLVLYHHDPDRTDDEVDAILKNARFWFKEKNSQIECTAAYEGLKLNI